jgi:hypothetical protein
MILLEFIHVHVGLRMRSGVFPEPVCSAAEAGTAPTATTTTHCVSHGLVAVQQGLPLRFEARVSVRRPLEGRAATMEGRAVGLAADMASGFSASDDVSPSGGRGSRASATSPVVPLSQHSFEIRASIRSGMLARAMERAPPAGYLEDEGAKCVRV